MPRRKGATPAQFVTASQALHYLADPKRGASMDGRAREARWDDAQARLITAHIKGRINLIGRKGDVADIGAKPGSLERIPNQYFVHDVVLGETLIARPRRKGAPVTREIWRDVKMARSEFEAEFKSASAEAALRRWWKETTEREGKPPTERDALLKFAHRQRPKLPRAWLCKQLKTLPKSWRRKGSGRPPGSKRKKSGDR